MSEPSSIYVSRKEAEAVEHEFAESLKQPAAYPVVFQIWGIGGVGKTTLIKRLREQHQQRANFAELSFRSEDVIQTPIELMAKLYEQLPGLPPMLKRDVSEVFQSDLFIELLEKYRKASRQLETQPLPGRKAVEPDQKNAVQQLLKGTATFGLPILTQGGVDAATAGNVSDIVLNAATTVLSVRDLIMQHSVTQKDKELQNLMLEPLPKLTKAFVESLSQRAAKRPVVVILDTYEKAPSSVDTWLCNVLLPLPELRSQPIRWVIAGRYNLTAQKEVWRKVQQDIKLLNGYDGYRLDRFNEDQVKEYFQVVGITEPREIKEIFLKTKGLPYYLNRIREAKLKGQTIDLTQDISNLFFPGLNSSQAQMLKWVACCRWFDRSLVKYLADQQGLSFPVNADGHSDWFEWLKQLDFLDSDLKPYGLDDVARDTLRDLLCKDDREVFHQTHGWLAAYFEERANQIIAVDRPEVEKYNDADWCRYTIEAIYHVLFSRCNDYQPKFLSHLFAAHFLNQIQVVVEPVGAIDAEATLQNHPLLPDQTRKFLNSLEMVVLWGAWRVLDKTPDQYEVDTQEAGINKTQVEQALQVCLSQIDVLEGLAKFAALFYKSKRYSNNWRIEWLLKAKAQAELIATHAEPEFSSSLFLWSIGNDFSELERYEEAIASYDKALEIKPDKHEAWDNRGVALGNLGRYEEANSNFDQALQIKPDYHQALTNRGVALRKLGQQEEAIASYVKALEFKLDDHEAWYRRGNALNELGRKEEAIASFDKALEIKQDLPVVWVAQGHALNELGRKEEAIASYDNALQFNTDKYESWVALGWGLYKLEQYRKSIASFDKALEIKQDLPVVWLCRGMALHALAQWEEAIASFDKILEFQPDNANAYYNKACCYGLQKKTDLAIETLKQAITLDSEWRESAKNDSDFDIIRDDQGFQALIRE